MSPGNFNGMLGEVMDGTADFAIADISITSVRASNFAFSMPWMNLGVSEVFVVYRVVTRTLLFSRYFYYLHQAPESAAKPAIIPGAI